MKKTNCNRLFCIIAGVFGILSSVFAVTSVYADPSIFVVSGQKQRASTKILKFATEATYPPFVTLDAKGNIGGFETELVKNICEKAGIQCEFHHKPFDSLFPSLNLNKIDAVYGCVGITEARKDQVLFSQSLYRVAVGFIFKGNFSEMDAIGLQKGTPGFEGYLKKHHPNLKIKTYASIQDALLDLKNNRIKGVFGDIPVFKHWEKSTNATAYQYLALKKEEVQEFSQGNGIAIRKEEQPLMDKINAAIDMMINDGSIQKLEKQYLE